MIIEDVLSKLTELGISEPWPGDDTYLITLDRKSLHGETLKVFEIIDTGEECEDSALVVGDVVCYSIKGQRWIINPLYLIESIEKGDIIVTRQMTAKKVEMMREQNRKLLEINKMNLDLKYMEWSRAMMTWQDDCFMKMESRDDDLAR